MKMNFLLASGNEDLSSLPQQILQNRQQHNWLVSRALPLERIFDIFV